jgi:hypothetical protein
MGAGGVSLSLSLALSLSFSPSSSLMFSVPPQLMSTTLRLLPSFGSFSPSACSSWYPLTG